VERCLACEADAVGTMEGAAFDRTPFACTFLELRVYQVGVCKPPKGLGVDRRAPANVS